MLLCRNDDDKCGIIRYSKLLLPFEYIAISSFSGGFCLGVKTNGNNAYLCELIKVRSNFNKPNPIHSTHIILKDALSLESLLDFMNNIKDVQEILDSLICYNEKVQMRYDTMDWFTNEKLSMHMPNNETEENDKPYNGSGGYVWTDKDSWDAMTDGQYGDYPGSGWDSEMFGY